VIVAFPERFVVWGRLMSAALNVTKDVERPDVLRYSRQRVFAGFRGPENLDFQAAWHHLHLRELLPG
jgi:hypothetical protein